MKETKSWGNNRSWRALEEFPSAEEYNPALMNIAGPGRTAFML
jgi:hypothetical protein